MVKKRGITFWLSVAWIALVMTCAVGAGFLPLPAPDQIDWACLATSPDGVHLLGTDNVGRDIAARLFFGARVSLTVGVIAPCIGLVFGSLLGVAAGFYRGWPERVIVGAIDVFLAVPRLVFLLVAMFVFGSGLPAITLALGLLCVPSFARMARANTIRFAGREFVLAARATGADDVAIVLREILPNALMPMVAYALLVMGYVIVAEGGLGFLGLSVPAPAPSWGGMIAEGREVLERAPHVSMIPAAAMFLTVLSVNLIGDGLRGWMDDRESQL